MKASVMAKMLLIFTLTLACSFLGELSDEKALESTVSALQTQLAETGGGQKTTPPAGGDITGGAESTPAAEAAESFTLLGQIGGSAYAVAAAGDYAYLGQGPRLITLDLSDPGKPQPVGQSQVLPGIVLGVQVAGRHAYVATRYGGLHILNIQNPAQPELISTLPLGPTGCQALEIKENLAYLACNPGGLSIVDISNPQRPLEVSRGALPGAMLSIALAGNYAYLVDTTSHGLVVADVSNPARPSQTGFFSGQDIPGSLPQSYGFSGVRVCGSALCLAALQDGLVVLDLSNPARPAFAGKYDTSTASGLATDGSRVYLVDDLDGMYILDVSNPQQPARLGLLPTAVGGFEFTVTETAERGMFSLGSLVYVTDQNHGLIIVDTGNAGDPIRVGHYQTPVPDWLQEVKAAGDYAYLVGRNSGFRVVDISDPARLREVGYDDGRKDLYLQNPTGLELQGKYAYISDANYPFHIYDISNPGKPTQVGAVFDHPASDGAFDIALGQNVAYLSGWGLQDAFYPGKGLWVIDAADPSQPEAVKFLDIPNERWQLATDGHYLYALDGSIDPQQSEPISLRIFDLSNPLQPVAVNTIAIPNAFPLGFSDLLLANGYLYLSLPPQELKVFDLSNPARPVEAATHSILMGANPKLEKEEDHLFLGALMAYDFANPQAPRLAGYAGGVFEAWSCDVVGDLVYIATKFHGLYVFRFTP